MIPRLLLEDRLKTFLAEDVAFEDVTTQIISAEQTSRAQIRAKSSGIVAGIGVVQVLFEMLNVEVTRPIQDGREVEPGVVVMELSGPTREILIGERTALNLLMRMSTIATTTAHLVDLIQTANPPRPVKVACTRKTTPGFRVFEKEAVKIAGGDVHRWNLDDMVLLKDTHLALTRSNIPGLLKGARGLASFSKKIEIEVESLEDAITAAQQGADIIMLDNMVPEQVQEVVKALEKAKLREKVTLEASGGINESSIQAYARTGVDIISCGFVTLFPTQTVDLSLKIVD